MSKRPVSRRRPGAVMDRRTRDRVGLEVVSTEARLRLTRLLRESVKVEIGSDEAGQIELIRTNRIVNFANTVLGRPIYALELSDWDYHSAEYAWHFAELELAMRRPDTAQLFEILIDLVNEAGLPMADVNAVLKDDGVGVRLADEDGSATVELQDVTDAPEVELEPGEHVNVRGLVERMDRALQDKDWSLVVHAGASVFETVAKQVVPLQGVQNQSLGSWFAAYRKYSKLSGPLLDAAEEIFKRRNVEPLAGHGSVAVPGVTEAEAIQIRELSVAFVRMERLLARIAPVVAHVGKGTKVSASANKGRSNASPGAPDKKSRKAQTAKT